MEVLELYTERLQLIPCTAPVARAALHDRAEAERLLDATLDEAWPGPDLLDFLPLYAEQVEADPTLLGWGIWLMVELESQRVIGDAGFKGSPDSLGYAELGYSVVPAFRRRGYATEAAGRLLRWAGEDERVRCVVAECLAENLPSIRTLEKLGFLRIGYEGERLAWEYRMARSIGHGLIMY